MVRIRGTGVELTLVSSTLPTCVIEFVIFSSTATNRWRDESRGSLDVFDLSSNAAIRSRARRWHIRKYCNRYLDSLFLYILNGNNPNALRNKSDPDDFRRMTSIHRKKCIAETKTTLGKLAKCVATLSTDSFSSMSYFFASFKSNDDFLLQRPSKVRNTENFLKMRI